MLTARDLVAGWEQLTGWVPPAEPLSAVLERTAVLAVDVHGDVVCGHCGARRTVGRREGDNGSFVCLAGCDPDPDADVRNRTRSRT